MNAHPINLVYIYLAAWRFIKACSARTPADHPLAIKSHTAQNGLAETFTDLITAIANGERPKLEKSFLMPLLQFVKKTGTRFTCSVGHDGFDITTDGDIYPCQVFINQDDFLMGTVDTFSMSNPSPQLQRAMRRLEFRDKYKNPICASCWARQFCFTCPGSDIFASNDYTVPERFCNSVRGWMEFVLSVLYEVRADPTMWKNFLRALVTLSKEMEHQVPSLSMNAATRPSLVPLAAAPPEQKLYHIHGVQ